MDRSYRPSRVCQMRGSTDEETAAYTITYVRIAEEGVRSRWYAIDGRPLVYSIADAGEPWPFLSLIPRPVNNNRLPLNVRQIHETPETAVVGIVPVVPHDEHFSLGNGDRPR